MRSVESIKSKALLPGSQNTQYVTGATVNVTGYNPTRNFTFDIDNSDISFGHNAIPIYDTRIINAFDNANYGDRFTTSVLLTYNNIQIDNGTEGIINYDNITTDSVPLSYIPLPLLIPNLSLLPITASYGDVDIQLVPTSNSNGAYTFSVDNTSVSTIVGANSNMLHIVGAGTANINVIQLADGIYDTTNITVSLIINKTLPDLTFSNIVANYGDANFQLLPSSNSDGSYNFSITPQAPGVVTIVGANNDYLDIIGHGSAVLTVTQAETANYLPQTVTATVTVNKIDPNLTFNPTLSLDYGAADYQLNPSSDGSGAYTFIIDPPAPNVVTIVGANNNKLRVVGAGSATLSIEQAETDNYTLDTTTVSITVNKILPNLTFNNITAIFGDTDILLVPTSNSDGAYTFSVVTPVPPASNVVTITGGNTLHIVGAGTAALNITQEATSNYLARTITASVTVNSGDSGLLYNDITVTYGDPNTTIVPTSDSTGAYTFTVDNTNVATIVNSNQLNIVGAGTATLTITQARTTNHVQTTINVPVTIAKAPPSLVFAPITATYGNNDFQLVPSSNSNGAYTFSVSPSTVATIIASGITWTTRTSAADNNWNSVAYGNGLWVAVAFSGTGNRVMTSPDGITWTTRTSAADNNWNSVAYGNGLWVAVAGSGTGNRVMTSPDGINWTIRTSAADNSWMSVAYGNGLWVAVAASGVNRVMTSPDGINWTLRTSAAENQWNSVAYGNGLWVAVSYSGNGDRVMTSPDGITWTIRTSAADNSWKSVAYGNGLWVAVSYFGSGNNVMTSPDGITWTSRTGIPDGFWLSVAYGNGLWVAVGETDKVMTSPDGINWTIITSDANNYWSSVSYDNGLWVAVAFSGTGNRVMTSNYNNNMFNNMLHIVGSGSATLTVTQAATSNYETQTVTASVTVNPNLPNLVLGPVTATYGDADFQLVPSSNSNGAYTFSVSPSSVATIVGANSNMLHIVGSGSATLTVTQAATSNYEARTVTASVTVNKASPGLRMSYGGQNSIYNTYGDGNVNIRDYLITNSNGDYTFSVSPSTVATIVGANSNMLHIVGSGSATLTVTQAATSNYEAQTINVPVTIAKALPNVTLSPITATYGDADFQFFPSSDSNGAYTFSVSPSTVATTALPSGINWVSRTGAASNYWSSVAYGNGLWVAVADSGSGNSVMTSPDGINWTIRTSAADNNWKSVAYGNGLWVAVASFGTGTGNRVMTSPDGINWTIRTSAADNAWSSVAYGNGLWVAVALNGIGNNVMTSPDGINWTLRTSAYDNTWSSVAYGNGLWVAVAWSGSGNRVMTSPDGINWTIRTSAADNSWMSVAYGNGLFVAVAVSGTGNRVMTSPDGITWTIRTSAADNNWKSVAYGNGLWVAVSYFGSGNNVMTSPDGITWTSRTGIPDGFWLSVAYGNGLWVAVGQTNNVMTSNYIVGANYNMLHFVAVGTATLTVTQAATSNYEAQTINVPVTVNPPSDSITSVTYYGISGLYRVYFTHNPINSWDPYNIIINFSFESNPRSLWVEQNITVVQISLYKYYVQFPLEYDPLVSIRLMKNSSPFTFFLSRSSIHVMFEPPVTKASNGVTNTCTVSLIPQGVPNPYIVESSPGSGIYYAIMSNSSDSISKINAYAKNTNNAPFIPNGQSSAVPFSNIVTTLMTDMSNMFYNAASFNQNLSTWDTSNVTNMTSMFYSAHSFNNGDNLPISGNTNSGIGYWNTSKVTNMTEVFYNAQNFNRDIGSWDVSSVNNMDRMFGFAYNFNNGNNIPSIGSWQTLNVQSMSATFYYASSFNRNISGWTVSGLSQNPMPYFSDGSGLNSNTIPDF